MVPYDGTPIKDELAKTGRLKGDICHPDYDFLDPRIDDFFQALNRIVHVSGWIHGIEALTPQLQFAKAEVAAIEALFPPLPGFEAYKEKLRQITRDANELLFRIVEDTSYVFTDNAPDLWSPEAVRNECEGFRNMFLNERNSFIGRNQQILMEALKDDIAREVAYA
jgi:hypothetical protein